MVARLAAERIDERTLQKLEKSLEKQQKCIERNDINSCTREDYNFRTLIHAVSGNVFHAEILKNIENKINPGQPLDKDIYGMSPEELKDIPKLPGSLDDSLEALRKDHKFLLKGDVFTEDVIETWIQYKYDKEVNPVRMRPSPLEFSLYFDI